MQNNYLFINLYFISHNHPTPPHPFLSLYPTLCVKACNPSSFLATWNDFSPESRVKDQEILYTISCNLEYIINAIPDTMLQENHKI